MMPMPFVWVFTLQTQYEEEQKSRGKSTQISAAGWFTGFVAEREELSEGHSSKLGAFYRDFGTPVEKTIV